MDTRMRMIRFTAPIPALLLLLLVAPAADAQKKKKGHPGVDQTKVDAAVSKGINWLRGQTGPAHDKGAPGHSNELLLYTFIHAGVPESDARFK